MCKLVDKKVCLIDNSNPNRSIIAKILNIDPHSLTLDIENADYINFSINPQLHIGDTSTSISGSAVKAVGYQSVACYASTGLGTIAPYYAGTIMISCDISMLVSHNVTTFTENPQVFAYCVIRGHEWTQWPWASAVFAVPITPGTYSSGTISIIKKLWVPSPYVTEPEVAYLNVYAAAEALYLPKTDHGQTISITAQVTNIQFHLYCDESILLDNDYFLIPVSFVNFID